MLIVLAPRPRAKEVVVKPYSCGNRSNHNESFKGSLSRKLKSLLIKQQDESDSYKQKAEVKKQRSVSECYFVVKGAALILPHDEGMHVYRKNSTNGGKSCDIQLHLKSMFYLLREEDTLRMAVKLESMHTGRTRYLVVVSCTGPQDSEESCLLGVDCGNKTTIGLVLPVWADTHITLDGDGGFSVSSSGRHHIFKPVSVQAMWSALQTLHKASAKAREYNYFTGGGTHQWIDYYEKCIESDRSCLNEWHAMDDLESRRPPSPDTIRSKPTEREATEKLIRTKLKELMMSVDLDEVTSKFIRTSLEEELDMNLNEYKSFIDQEMLMILGQMDAPTEIFEYLYLGSEWNASNLDELKANGVDHILNVTREIDNFFPGMFDYLNVRVYDDETTEMLKYWDKTFKYIRQVKSLGSKVLVHCKMGISRSASVVIAYVMKAYDWDLERALEFVKNKRNCIKPNQGFVKQLEIYQGILDASKQRHNSLWRSKSETNLKSDDRDSCMSQNSSNPGGDEHTGSCLHLSLPGSVSRPKSWSPDDSVVETLFPTCPLVFDKPFQPLQRYGTDPSCYLNLESVIPSPKSNAALATQTNPREDVIPETVTTLTVNTVVPRVSSIKDRINELESQAITGAKTESKQTLASSKSGLVINLATQFESVSKPNTPSSEDELTTIENLLPSKSESELQGVDPIVSQTKPPVSKHQAILVKPNTWNQDAVEPQQIPLNSNEPRLNYAESHAIVNSEQLLQTHTGGNNDKTKPDCCAMQLDINQKFDENNSCVNNSQLDHQNLHSKKPSHSVREIYSRQSSVSSCLSSPKSVEPFLWSRQSSCSSPGVNSPPINQRWTNKDQTPPSSNEEAVIENALDSISPPLEQIEIIPTDIKSIRHRLLSQEDSNKKDTVFNNNALTKSSLKGEFLYEKEDIPWTPGTVRRTKQQIESNTLKRTTSFDSAFPAQSRSTPSTPPELSLEEIDSVTAVHRSHSLHNEHRHHSRAFQTSPISHSCRKKKFPPNNGRRMSHSKSTPSVVEAVNQVLCGTREVLITNSAIQALPSPSTIILEANVDGLVTIEACNPQPGIVKQNRELLENLTPKNNTQNATKITTSNEDASTKNRKEFGNSLANVNSQIATVENPPPDETDANGSYGVVKRLTKELEAKASSPGHKKEKVIIIDKDNEAPSEKECSSMPSSPSLGSRIALKDAPLLRKPRTQSEASDRNSISEVSMANPVPRCRKTSLDLDKMSKNPGDNSTTENGEVPKPKVVTRLPPVPSNGLPKNEPMSQSLNASTGRPPPGVKYPFGSIPPPPPPPPCGGGLVKKARKLQQGKSHPLSKLTVKQRHANPLYNTM